MNQDRKLYSINFRVQKHTIQTKPTTKANTSPKDKE